jgi:hypothetical protein
MVWVWLRGMPFRVVLPLLAVVVWVGIVAVPAVMLDLQLRQVTGNVRNANVGVGTFHTTIPPRRFGVYALNATVVTHSHVITAVNLPGAMVEMPVSLATTQPEAWFPKGLDQTTGRVVATLVYGLPAWWVVGLGLEALLGRRRLRWPWMVLGVILSGLMGLTACGFLFGWSGGNGSGWVYAGLGLWTALFAVLPVAWVRRRIVGGRGGARSGMT